jgi:hypothetical protein
MITRNKLKIVSYANTHLHLVQTSKNEWSYTSTPQYTFMVWCLVKGQGQLYLYLLNTTQHNIYKHIPFPACGPINVNKLDARFEVFRAMEIQVEIFWIMTQRSVVLGCKLFGGSCCLNPECRKQQSPRERCYSTITRHCLK